MKLEDGAPINVPRYFTAREVLKQICAGNSCELFSVGISHRNSRSVVQGDFKEFAKFGIFPDACVLFEEKIHLPSQDLVLSVLNAFEMLVKEAPEQFRNGPGFSKKVFIFMDFPAHESLDGILGNVIYTADLPWEVLVNKISQVLAVHEGGSDGDDEASIIARRAGSVRNDKEGDAAVEDDDGDDVSMGNEGDDEGSMARKWYE